jgi:hypothetical protein
MGSANESDWPCDLTLNMPAELVDNDVLVFGELHGTKEAPFAFLSAICERLSLSGDEAVLVGLEYPIAEAESLLDYIRSSGSEADQERLLSTPFWSREMQDGRTSVAMLELIEALRYLKQETGRLDVFAIVPNSGSGRHDELMADAINESIKKRPSSPHFILVGNYHSRKTVGRRGDEGFRSMVHWIDSDPLTVAVASKYGDYWACTMDGCGRLLLGEPNEGEFGTLRSARPRVGENPHHDFALVFDSFSASPPAKGSGTD